MKKTLLFLLLCLAVSGVLPAQVPQQRITVRGDGMGTAPVIPLAYLTVLSAKLVAMAFPNEQTAAELSDYDDERVMIVLGERLQTILEDLAGMPDGDDGASPVC